MLNCTLAFKVLRNSIVVGVLVYHDSLLSMAQALIARWHRNPNGQGFGHSENLKAAAAIF